ncbi:MAG: hypothetical protein ACJAYU_002946 [Bradymonadia bacterium]|jgi:hypothetical protein
MIRTLASFTCVLAAASVGCGGDDTPTGQPSTGSAQDIGASPDTGSAPEDTGSAEEDTGSAEEDTGSAADTSPGTDASSGSDTGSEADASEVPLSDMISALTQPCYDFCLLGNGCDVADFPELGECEEYCDSDAGYILGNAQDDQANRDCLAAMLTSEACLVALDCDDLADWWAEDSGIYPCSAEDNAEEAACTGLTWYDEF